MDLWKKAKRSGSTRRNIIKGQEDIIKRGCELAQKLINTRNSEAGPNHLVTHSFTAMAPVVLKTVLVNNNLFINDVPHAFTLPSTSASLATSECINIGSNESVDPTDLGVCFVIRRAWVRIYYTIFPRSIISRYRCQRRCN